MSPCQAAAQASTRTLESGTEAELRKQYITISGEEKDAGFASLAAAVTPAVLREDHTSSDATGALSQKVDL